ncbi:MAG: IclR family transcriptional regulator [Thiolinea sp.]
MSQDNDKDNAYLVPGLMRGLDILRMFRRDRQVLDAPEIAEELGIPRTTVFRLLQTLESAGFIVKANGGRSYQLGVAVLGLGFAFLATQDITELARPILERLRDNTRFATHLVIRDGRDVVYLLRFPGHSALNFNIGVGTRLPAHATSMGRVLLSELSAKKLEELYHDSPLVSTSNQTPLNLIDLKALLEQDRQRGYIISEGFFEKGINAIAVPVREASGRIVAVINLIVREGEVERERLYGELLEQVLSAAQQLSLGLGYSTLKRLSA